MALGVSEDHLELATSVRGYAERHGGPLPGLLGLHVPEESGGQGYGLAELAVALEELGDALIPGGFLPTVLASSVLASSGPARSGGAGETQKLLAGLADGSRSGAVALDAGPAGTATGGGLILDGESGPVLG